MRRSLVGGLAGIAALGTSVVAASPVPAQEMPPPPDVQLLMTLSASVVHPGDRLVARSVDPCLHQDGTAGVVLWATAFKPSFDPVPMAADGSWEVVFDVPPQIPGEEFAFGTYSFLADCHLTGSPIVVEYKAVEFDVVDPTSTTTTTTSDTPTVTTPTGPLSPAPATPVRREPSLTG